MVGAVHQYMILRARALPIELTTYVYHDAYAAYALACFFYTYA